MRFGRNTVHALFVLSLPVIVAMFGLGVVSAIALVLVALLWRWGLTLTGLLSKATGPELTLETISVSHFVEKVRWCMDRLGVPYTEQHNVATVGAFFIGRTVPRLHVRTGAVISVIGDSPAILRYLWGRYAAEFGERAVFLEPGKEALALEAETDRYGVLMQQWIYHHILPHRKLTLHLWGLNDPTLPGWQRAVIFFGFPVIRVMMRRAFRLTPGSHPRTVEKTEAFLQRMEGRLADGRQTLLGGEPGFADITFAALSGIWVRPENYGGGKATAVRPDDAAYPESLETEVLRWKQSYPNVTAFVERMYQEHRGSS
ncbi:MAG: glutathione S-transferase C-terminal domain-containing protein [Gammaproteobacteria bacterium]|nr:glutathione S-transferase C-terminal domain-containing protein [Gammaproteobacteria bacterium]